jgi:hypothetical protein
MKTKKKKKPQRPDPKVFEKAVKLFGHCPATRRLRSQG